MAPGDRGDDAGPEPPAPDGGTTEWPVDLGGITESLVATEGPNGRWNVAPLGLVAGDPVTARTWGRTRTRRNFERNGEGYVQFATDPELFVRAALDVVERDGPVLEEAAAWAAVALEERDRGHTEGTEWVTWNLRPTESRIERRTVPTTNRGYNAVVEATVAASRLDVAAYDRAELLDRIAHLESVVERCGSDADREAMATLLDLIGGLGE